LADEREPQILWLKNDFAHGSVLNDTSLVLSNPGIITMGIKGVFGGGGRGGGLESPKVKLNKGRKNTQNVTLVIALLSSSSRISIYNKK
jgi:hypothetical protein